MTDRIRTLTVVLDRDYREDDVAPLIEVIRYVKGVADVHKGDAITIQNHLDREIAARELKTQIIALLLRAERGEDT